MARAYASSESGEVCGKLRVLLDDVGQIVSASQKARMVRNFLDASRYQYVLEYGVLWRRGRYRQSHNMESSRQART
jgi:hypothetical protein